MHSCVCSLDGGIVLQTDLNACICIIFSFLTVFSITELTVSCKVAIFYMWSFFISFELISGKAKVQTVFVQEHEMAQTVC